MMVSTEQAVPKQLRPLFEDLVRRTDAFCLEYLNEEYAQLCRQLTAALCRKRPSPLTHGKVESWAAGIVYAIGSVNFLFDKNETPHMSAAELSERFGVSKSTASGKSTQILKALDIEPYDPRWCLPSKLDDNPLVWFIQVDGMVVDARRAPRHIQEEALRLGLIPYLPGEPKGPPREGDLQVISLEEEAEENGKERRFNFFLNPYDDLRFTTCPRCGQKTKLRKLPLVVLIDGPMVLSLNMTCRYCSSCDLLIAHQDELEGLMTSIFQQRAPEIIGHDYNALGTVDRSIWQRGVEGEITGDDIVDNLYEFKEVWSFERPPRWAPP